MFHERTKHISVQNHFVRDVVARVDITMSKVNTHDIPMDMMNKPLLVVKFEHCLNSVDVDQ